MRKLQTYLDNISVHAATGEDWSADLVVWLMFLGGSVTPDNSTRSWLIARLPRISVQLGFNYRDDVKTLLLKFFWVETIHQTLYMGVWDEVVMGMSIVN